MANHDDSSESSILLGKKCSEILTFDKRDISFEAERMRDDLEPEDVARVCSDPRANRLASLEREALSRLAGNLDYAVYVATSDCDPISKIGVTKNPVRRMESLQVGSHKPLRISHLFWMPRGTAFAIEQLCLKVAKEIGARLTGEWVGLPADSTAKIISVVAMQSGSPFGDSGMFRRNAYQAMRKVDVFTNSASFRKDHHTAMTLMGY